MAGMFKPPHPGLTLRDDITASAPGAGARLINILFF